VENLVLEPGAYINVIGEHDEVLLERMQKLLKIDTNKEIKLKDFTKTSND